MALVIACLILGLALCIERILYLGFSKTNTKKLLAALEEALKNGGVEAATEVCRNTRGPVASIFTQMHWVWDSLRLKAGMTCIL